MVDSSHIEIPFVSTWREEMNLCKGFTFANKVEVKRVLTICALKENIHFMISRLTRSNFVRNAWMSHASGMSAQS